MTPAAVDGMVSVVSGVGLKKRVERLSTLAEGSQKSKFPSTIDLSSLGQLNTVEEKRRGLDYAKLAANFCTVTGYGDYITRLSIFDDNDVHISAGTALSSVDDGRRIQNAPWFDRELKKDMYDYRLDRSAFMAIRPEFCQSSDDVLFPYA